MDAYQIPEEFPARVITQAEKCPEEVIPNDYNGRLDLKSWQMVTIDGEDAKDLDDAVSVTKRAIRGRLAFISLMSATMCRKIPPSTVRR